MASKLFLLTLISKNELECSRKVRSELLLELKRAQNIDNIDSVINNYHRGIDFDFILNEKVPVNLIQKETEYIVCVNKDGDTVYSESIVTYEKAKNRFIYFLLKNQYLEEVIGKGKFNGYTLDLTTEEYDFYFKPLPTI